MGVRRNIKRRIKKFRRKKPVRRALKKGLSRGASEWNKFRKMMTEEGVKSQKKIARMWKQFKKDNESHFKKYRRYPKVNRKEVKKVIRKWKRKFSR